MFFLGQTLFCPYFRNGWSDWCVMKRKCIGSILGIICDLDLDLTHDLDLGCFKVKFWKSCIWGIVGLIDVKWKDSELIWYHLTLPLDHTHDLDLGVSRSESEIAISQEWGGQMTWNERMWVIHSWPCYWLVWPWWGGRMYRIMTSDVGLLSTYLVSNRSQMCGIWLL